MGEGTGVGARAGFALSGMRIETRGSCFTSVGTGAGVGAGTGTGTGVGAGVDRCVGAGGVVIIVARGGFGGTAAAVVAGACGFRCR